MFIPVHRLPAEITQTSYEAVTVNCSGFRVIGNGGHVLPKVPKLQDLLQLETVTLAMLDRQEPDTAKAGIMAVQNCIPINYSTGANAKIPAIASIAARPIIIGKLFLVKGSTSSSCKSNCYF